MRNLTTITDYFVICTGDVDVHLRAIADAIIDGLKNEGINYWHIEGYENASWILLDYVDVVVHIFQPETRQYYSLEKLWGDAEKIVISNQ